MPEVHTKVALLMNQQGDSIFDSASFPVPALQGERLWLARFEQVIYAPALVQVPPPFPDHTICAPIILAQ